MDDLRWILLLVGGLVIAAVYFSSRFEREDWVREREQFDARKQSAKKGLKNRITKKAVSGQQSVRQMPSPVSSKSRKEPQMTSSAAIAKSTIDADEPIAPVMLEKSENDESVSDAYSNGKESIEIGSVEKSVVKEPEAKSKPETETEAEVKTTTTTSVEEKMLFESREPDGQTEIATPSDSEIPAEVLLSEEPVDVPEKMAAPKDDLTDKNEMPRLSARPGIEDEIISIEIPADLAIAEAELQTSRQENLHKTPHKEGQANDTQDLDSEELALPPNFEPLVLVLTVMAEDDPFTGPAVQEALEAEGLRHGEMRIFHCFDESLDANAEGDSDELSNADTNDEHALPIFSTASLVEPGYFELEKIHEMEMPGLTFFCQLPGPLSGPQSGEAAFNIMLDKGRGVAVRLHGQLCDDKRNVFTTQAKTHYLDRIATFQRELSVAKKKADV